VRLSASENILGGGQLPFPKTIFAAKIIETATIGCKLRQFICLILIQGIETPTIKQLGKFLVWVRKFTSL
jgi:hypothetical protein